MSDLDQLRGLGDRLVPPPLGALRQTAARRDRRHSVAAALASAAAVVVVVVGIALLADSNGERTAPPPADSPGPTVTTRPLTYADGDTIHYGDRTLDAPGPVQELDVTDDGVAFRTSDDRIWFTDGSKVEELGTLGKPKEPGPDAARHWTQAYLFSPVLTSAGWMVSGNSGSRLAWFEFPRPDAPEVVVYDTRAREVVVREQVAVAAGSWAAPHSVDDESVYLFLDPDVFADDHLPQARLDVATGEQAPVSAEDYLADIGSHPARTVQTDNEITDGTTWNFRVQGGRVQPQGMAPPVRLSDGLTGKRFAFDAPDGYPRNNRVWLVQWLDDDSVVLLSTTNDGDDLIECHLSTGACEIAVSGPASLVVPEIG